MAGAVPWKTPQDQALGGRVLTNLAAFNDFEVCVCVQCLMKSFCQRRQQLQMTGWAGMGRANPKQFALHRLAAPKEIPHSSGRGLQGAVSRRGFAAHGLCFSPLPSSPFWFPN